MFRSLCTTALLVPLLIVSTTASANPEVDRMFAEQDANRDGVIDQAEARAEAARVFQQLDTNRDAVLGIAELDPQIAKGSPGGAGFPPDIHVVLRQATMQLWDANGDGRITLAETQQAFVDGLLKADHDGDGKVTRTELIRMHQGVVAPAR
ncbi:EF-hand domain-containing protein [Luteimonas terrae]|uniref:Ca2+-binding EF-hand superfamily protein n=1 Tax=Luteimonas terrae TaxID=1530191 RepID=A0ABU1XTI0_9GAMM|nr:EF-hand domain-containing protein [Luteimonas terrae]MDR7192063.1 Ca2+-binding EF-hand superfamily protein [Luteimonas terrae]